MVCTPAVKRALLLLSQTTHDFLLYNSMGKLLNPPNHQPDILTPLSDNTVNMVRWISALTKFTRFFLYYRYVNGKSLQPGEMAADCSQFSAPCVLEQLRNWISAGFVGEFAHMQISPKAVARHRGEKVQGLPMTNSHEARVAVLTFEKNILKTAAKRDVPVIEVIYDVLVGGISIEQAAEVGERLTKMVIDWKDLFSQDLLDHGCVRAENCGGKSPDGHDRLSWDSGGWRLKGLLPLGIFWPPKYDWLKYKPLPVSHIPIIHTMVFQQRDPPCLGEVIAFEEAEKALNDTCCAICRNNWELTDKLSKLPCNHAFHKECIDNWWEHREKYGHRRITDCPLCRKVYSMKKDCLFHPDTIPFREPGRRGRDWCWERGNLPRHSPEHYLLNRFPARGTHRWTHRGLLMWMYVREIYNHGRRLCWAIRELGLPESFCIRTYEGLAVWEDVGHLNEALDTRSIPSLQEYQRYLTNSTTSPPLQHDMRNRWEDFGWGGITLAFLRELGASEEEITRVVSCNPSLAPRVPGLGEEPDVDLSSVSWL